VFRGHSSYLVPSEQLQQRRWPLACLLIVRPQGVGYADGQMWRCAWLLLQEHRDTALRGRLRNRDNGKCSVCADVWEMKPTAHVPRCGTIASVAFILWRVKQAANKLCWLASTCKYNTQGSYSYNHCSGQRGSAIDH
jgi:hypothetical protein